MNKYILAGFIFIFIGLALFVVGSLLGVPFIVFGMLFQLKGRGVIQNIIYKAPRDISFESRVLRLSIAAYWIVFSCAIVIYPIETATLSTPLTEFMDKETESISSWAMSGMFVFFFIYFIGSAGVFFLQRWGRNAYAVGFLGTLIAAPFLGAVVVTPIFGVFETLSTLLNGVSLYLLYFSQARAHFTTETKERNETN